MKMIFKDGGDHLDLAAEIATYGRGPSEIVVYWTIP